MLLTELCRWLFLAAAILAGGSWLYNNRYQERALSGPMGHGSHCFQDELVPANVLL